MTSKQHPGAVDFTIIGVSLIIPVLMGVKFRFSGGRQRSTGEYFLAGRNTSMVPVVMSSSVSVLSSILMIGAPAENYRYGPQFTIQGLGTAVGQLVTSFVFIPIYFQCGVFSVHELLEMRFGKYTRYSISAVFIVQTMLYMCSVLLGPVLALSAVTDFSMEMAIIAFGAVCTFYCVLGGLKAVLWTDVFQAGLMFTCVIILYVTGISEVGSLGEVVRRASAGQRLNFFNFQFDFETRYTFWNCFTRGLGFGLAFWGTSQIEVQRSLSMSGSKRAQASVRWSILPVLFLQLSFNLFGVLLYAVFYLCDPLSIQKETGITKYDQLVPYFIVSRLHSIPGLTGLCIAGIFSGSLSTMSSALNSLSTVTVVDFIQPAFSRLTDTRTVFIAKMLGLLYGGICIGLTFAIIKIDSLLQAAVIFQGISEGPVLAIFLIGVLTRKANDKSTVFGILVGVAAVCWIGFGTLFGGYRAPQLPLETSGCSMYQNTTLQLISNSSVLCANSSDCSVPQFEEEKIFSALYKMPYTWIPTIGCLTTICAVFILSVVIDGNKDVIPPDSKCLSPVFRYWMNYCSPKVKMTVIEQEDNHDLKNFNSS